MQVGETILPLSSFRVCRANTRKEHESYPYKGVEGFVYSGCATVLDCNREMGIHSGTKGKEEYDWRSILLLKRNVSCKPSYRLHPVICSRFLLWAFGCFHPIHVVLLVACSTKKYPHNVPPCVSQYECTHVWCLELRIIQLVTPSKGIGSRIIARRQYTVKARMRYEGKVLTTTLSRRRLSNVEVTNLVGHEGPVLAWLQL